MGGAGIAQWYSAGLRAGWSGVRVPTRAGDFSLHHRVQTGSGAHPASCPMGNSGTFPGVKRQQREADHSPPSSAEVKNALRYTALPQYTLLAWCSVKAEGQLYLTCITRLLISFYIVVFWVVAPCDDVAYWRFGGPCWPPPSSGWRFITSESSSPWIPQIFNRRFALYNDWSKPDHVEIFKLKLKHLYVHKSSLYNLGTGVFIGKIVIPEVADILPHLFKSSFVSWPRVSHDSQLF
jgi:hypothetical protein